MDKYKNESISADNTTTDTNGDIEVAGKETELLEEVNAIVDRIDVNKDGMLPANELWTYLVEIMGYSFEFTTYLFALLNTNADRVIRKEEMMSAFYNFERSVCTQLVTLGGVTLYCGGLQGIHTQKK